MDEVPARALACLGSWLTWSSAAQGHPLNPKHRFACNHRVSQKCLVCSSPCFGILYRATRSASLGAEPPVGPTGAGLQLCLPRSAVWLCQITYQAAY